MFISMLMLKRPHRCRVPGIMDFLPLVVLGRGILFFILRPQSNAAKEQKA